MIKTGDVATVTPCHIAERSSKFSLFGVDVSSPYVQAED